MPSGRSSRSLEARWAQRRLIGDQLGSRWYPVGTEGLVKAVPVVVVVVPVLPVVKVAKVAKVVPVVKVVDGNAVAAAEVVEVMSAGAGARALKQPRATHQSARPVPAVAPRSP